MEASEPASVASEGAAGAGLCGAASTESQPVRAQRGLFVTQTSCSSVESKRRSRPRRGATTVAVSPSDGELHSAAQRPEE